MPDNKPKNREELCKRLAAALLAEIEAHEEYLNLAAGVMEVGESKSIAEIAKDEADHRCIVQDLINVLCPCEVSGK